MKLEVLTSSDKKERNQGEMILALAILIGLLLPDVTRSCPCNNPQPFDFSSRLSCTHIRSVINGIRGKRYCRLTITSLLCCFIAAY